VVVVAGLLALVGTSLVGAVPSGAEPAVPLAAAIEVTPATGLVQGDDVTITGSGFPASSLLAFVQCVPGGGQEDCNLANLVYVNSDATGSFSTSFTPQRILRVQGVDHDCADVGACVIGGGTVPDGSGGSAVADIRFDPSVPPPPPPSLTASPDTGLVQGDDVTVTGSDFPSNAFLGVIQCIPGTGVESCNMGTLQYVTASPSGNFSTVFTPRRILRIQGVDHDCAIETCRIGAGTVPDGSLGSASVDIAFDPSVPPPPPPTVTVTPDTDLLDGDTVSVSGADWGSGSQVVVLQCRTGAVDPGGCNTSHIELATTDGAGSFTTTFTVDRILYVGGSRIDCADPGACTVSAALTSEIDTSAGAPIQFDPSVPPPPPPALTATPSTDLADGQTVTVVGTGFPRNTSLGMTQCRTGDESPSGCDLGNVRFVTTDADGGFTAEYVVHLTYPSTGGTVDCSVADMCRIGAGLAPGGVGASALLSFAAPSPVPPGPGGSDPGPATPVQVAPTFAG
jgi:hypothetical protein